MNRIIRDHYPANRLPEDLREGLAPDAEVRVTIDAPPFATGEGLRADAFSRYKHLRRVNFDSDEAVDAYVEASRDEARGER